MAASLIIERIANALNAGELKRVPDGTRFTPIDCISDLLRPWEELYPGVERCGENDTRSIFSWSGLRKPKMLPQVRRSARPLPAPRAIAASPSTVSPGLLDSISAIWKYYQLKQLAGQELSQLPFDDQGMVRFIQPLYDVVSDWYPLFLPLEMLGEQHDSVRQLDCIQLCLPHYTYEDEAAGVVEAFLSGTESLAGLLSHYYGETSLDLPDKDNDIIATHGFEKLIETYTLYPGGTDVDLTKLFSSTYGTCHFFGPLEQRFPEQMKTPWPIISGNAGYDSEIPITCPADIDFALAYARAYDSMISTMPDPYDFDNNECGTCGEFIHELCNVWRKSNNKRPIKWTSPNRAINRLQIQCNERLDV